jgi:hypothetical protein
MDRTFIKKIIFLILFLVFAHNISPSRVLANGGPLYRGGAGTGFYEFDENSGIELVEESVTFDYVELPNKMFYAKYGVGNVTVIYKLKNNTNSHKIINMLFITPEAMDSYSVKLNNKEVKTEVMHNVVPSNWIAEFKKSNAENYLREPIKVPPGQRTIKFPLDIKVNESIDLGIKYNSQSSVYAGRGVVNQEFYEVYYLTPAKFWEGQPKVNLKINFPNNKKFAVTSNLPLKRISESTFEAKLSSLPDSEWMFSFFETTNLIFGTNNQLHHNIFTLALTVLLSLIFFVIEIKYKRGYITLVSYPLIFMFLIKFFYKVGDSVYSYLILKPLVFILALSFLVVLYRKSTHHLNQNN